MIVHVGYPDLVALKDQFRPMGSNSPTNFSCVQSIYSTKRKEAACLFVKHVLDHLFLGETFKIYLLGHWQG